MASRIDGANAVSSAALERVCGHTGVRREAVGGRGGNSSDKTTARGPAGLTVACGPLSPTVDCDGPLTAELRTVGVTNATSAEITRARALRTMKRCFTAAAFLTGSSQRRS